MVDKVPRKPKTKDPESKIGVEVTMATEAKTILT
jgi:hypothetical protein